MYCQRTAPDSYDLNQVGLTLKADSGKYSVAAIARKNGRPTVATIHIGDKVIRIGPLELNNATRGQIYDAMHGKPGEIKVLEIEHGGKQMTVSAPVTQF